MKITKGSHISVYVKNQDDALNLRKILMERTPLLLVE